MAQGLGFTDVKEQSEAVFNQFGHSKWIPAAKENAKLERGDSRDFANRGLGKFAVLIGMGPSLENNIDAIKKYRDRVDVITCDKGFGALLRQGVKADYVICCDTNIQFKWLRPHLEETKDVALIATPYASTDWTHFWKGPKYFFVNRDAIKSERHFIEIMGEKTVIIPAGSNVSNAMLIFFSRCDETSNVNYAAYTKYFLTGYDYSWAPDTNYYAWNNPEPKRFYMHHRTLLGIDGNTTFTSENLVFSAKWMKQYVTTFNLPVVNCSERGILDISQGNMEESLKRIKTDPAHRAAVMSAYDRLSRAHSDMQAAKVAFAQSREALIWQ